MIPTYNEKENIERLIKDLFSLEVGQDGNLEVVIVDDDSPDGTGTVCDQLSQEFKGRVHVIHRKQKRGRGSAGIEGLKFCLSRDVDFIMEMDADFSHDPKYIPVFISLVNYFDVVIGSRYVEGGAQLGREWHREITSLMANLIYRLILGMRIRDISGGFKCYRKETLAMLNFDDFFSDGYSVGMEILYRLYKKDCSFVEIPVIFSNRQYGASKFNVKAAINAIRVALALTRRVGARR